MEAKGGRGGGRRGGYSYGGGGGGDFPVWAIILIIVFSVSSILGILLWLWALCSENCTDEAEDEKVERYEVYTCGISCVIVVVLFMWSYCSPTAEPVENHEMPYHLQPTMSTVDEKDERYAIPMPVPALATSNASNGQAPLGWQMPQ